MPDVSFDNLVIVSLIAVLAPLLLGFTPGLRIPAIVLEIVGGVVVGPSMLGWVEVDLPVSILALLGLTFLLLLAGLEIDLHRLRGRLLTVALVGFGITLVLALGASLGFTAVGWLSSPLIVAVALCATGLGLIVPVLKDAGQADSDVGQTTIAASSVADFGAVLLLSFLFSMSATSTAARLVLVLAFALLVALTAYVITRSGRSMRLSDVVLRLQDTTAEIRVRLTVLLLVGFAVLAERFGLESILGAFVAGAMIGALDKDSSTHPHLRTKLEAIGYGFLVPVFFVTSGLRLDLTGLAEDPGALVRVPLFLLALLLARGVPAVLYVSALGRRAALAAALLQATSLPFIVAATQIGVETGRLSPTNAAALVFAGLLSVLVFPPVALSLLRGADSRGASPAVDQTASRSSEPL
ncbi:cation:proton antiporter [Nocardioides iriomotensis]|uniref:Cation:proton antiporter n=1 Tax=Nocardioides iriomotensis TaxID=715784 RepID=A0A4V1Z165_9ACTN|nr:cation:proton antiporter [Nocardioides iriomotensis]RYU09826.1 cation:proton antiporter [Nocardioides iriomotensis]